MILNRLLFITILFLLPLVLAKGQVANRENLIQVTGIVSDEEKNPVPGVSIISLRLKKGTISELSGIYDIISIKGDTIWLSALGYKKALIYIPSDLDSKQYTKDITLLNDTIAIKEVVIFPWKNYEEFKRAVLAEKNIDPALARMYLNLASIQTSIQNTPNYSVTPEAGFRMAMQQNANALYSRGQSPVNNLFNPFAWAKFFQGLKNGLFKNQKFNKPAKIKAAKIRKKKT